MNSEEKETRSFEIAAQEIDNRKEIFGTAIVFDVPSERFARSKDGKLIKFKEVIEKRALDNTDMSNTVLTHNHKDVIARVKNNTLELIKTEIGLDIRARLSDTQKSKDIYTEIKEGLLPEMSFAFPIEEYGTIAKIEKRGNEIYRVISHIPKLIDVSTVYEGAYPQTEVYVRSLELLNASEDKLASSRAFIEKTKSKLKLKLKLMEDENNG